METKKYYAGIGSQKTPEDVCRTMSELAYDLRTHGWWLRSGAAKGADQAFEGNAGEHKQIFTAKSDISDKAFEIAKELHPAWGACNPYVKRLHARNVLQILGQNLDTPVEFVVCWTPDGCESDEDRTRTTGGTGQAISLASLSGIPVYNLANGNDRLERVRNYMNEV